jgi:hypothetical protein
MLGLSEEEQILFYDDGRKQKKFNIAPTLICTDITYSGYSGSSFLVLLVHVLTLLLP